MKRYIPLLLGLAVLGLFIFGCETIVDQELIHPTFTDIDGYVGKMVPFRGSGTWQAIAFSDPDFEEMEIEITVKINGTATHLGRLEGDWTGLYKFEVLLDDYGEPIIDPDTEYPVIIPTDYVSHSTIYTAANGDKLYDAGCEEYFPDDDGIGFVMTGVQIDGGTGRFENAVGWYDIEVPATVGFPFPAGTWELEGWISTVGSTRRGR